MREASQRKDEFLVVLAHELRNPLAPIRAATEILCRPDTPESEQRRACEIIKRQVQQMTRLVDDLLDMSRVAAGRVHLQCEPIELGTLLGMTVDSLRPAFENKRQILAVALTGEPIYVNGDRARIMQVFSNILQNANKYTPPAGHVDVELRRADRCALVSVRDSGIGIPSAMLDRVFELFAQVDRSYDRTGGSLGVGLALARHLIEMHGGRIEARSEGAHRGSEFIVRLPLIDAPRIDTAALAPAAVTCPPRRILIADDNADTAETLSVLLQIMGHDTRVVHDGLAAVDVAEAFCPEVIFLDLEMPRLDGYEAARRIGARPSASKAVIVALTGWGQETDRLRAKEAGFHHHLVKPVDPRVLIDLLASTSVGES